MAESVRPRSPPTPDSEGPASVPHSSPPRSANTGGAGATTRIISCVLCQQRKVKCDRKWPCSTCTKHRVDCVFRPPVPPRRKKKRKTEEELLERVRELEGLLKVRGIPLENEEDRNEDKDMDESGEKEHRSTYGRMSSFGLHLGYEAYGRKQFKAAPEIEDGMLFVEQGQAKYMENNLWSCLSNELRDMALEEGSRHHSKARCGWNDFHNKASEPEPEAEDDSADMPFDYSLLLLCGSSNRVSLRDFHPQPVHIFKLWQVFVDSVNPLCRLCHAPSCQQMVLDASGNLDAVPRNQEALLFAIYAAAVSALDEEDCLEIFGEARGTLLKRYRTATQRALVNAKFLRVSDCMVLQALVIHLLCIRDDYDARSLWILSGVALRLGQRIGLHRDGALLNIPPFGAEMRRRLWWQMVILDSRAGKLSGNGSSVLAHMWDTQPPLNLNDTDLYPSMNALPAPHTGATEMLFCLSRYEFGQFLHHSTTRTKFDGGWVRVCKNFTVAQKDVLLDEFERYLEDKYLKYCDPLIPVHFISALSSRSALCILRLVAHHPMQYADKGVNLPQRERDVLFENSLKIIEHDNAAYANKHTRRLLWHVNVFFHLDGFIHLLNYLKSHLAEVGELQHEREAQAWRAVEKVYDNHKEFYGRGNVLYVAIGRLCVQAWDVRAERWGILESPAFVEVLRGLDVEENGKKLEQAGWLEDQDMPTGTSPMDWTYWDELLQQAMLG